MVGSGGIVPTLGASSLGPTTEGGTLDPVDRRKQLRRLANACQCDVRTVKRVIAGEPTRRAMRSLIRAKARSMHISLAVDAGAAVGAATP
jgi:hypothetical protein